MLYISFQLSFPSNSSTIMEQNERMNQSVIFISFSKNLSRVLDPAASAGKRMENAAVVEALIKGRAGFISIAGV